MKCLYCRTEPNNKTTKDNLYVCSCYKLHADYTFGVKYEQHHNGSPKKIPLGQKVKCFGYLKKTNANYIITDTDDFGKVRMSDLAYRTWEDHEKDINRIEDYDDQNRFELIDKEFEGIYVGITTVNLNLACESFSDSYTEGWKTETNTPFKCARIYYADNLSRLVPLDRLESIPKHSSSYYIRFGEVPKDGKSNIYRNGEIVVGKEKGVSVYRAIYAEGNYYPILPESSNEGSIDDYFNYLLNSSKMVYLVTGDELKTRGSDGEPLLTNVQIVKEITHLYRGHYLPSEAHIVCK